VEPNGSIPIRPPSNTADLVVPGAVVCAEPVHGSVKYSSIIQQVYRFEGWPKSVSRIRAPRFSMRKSFDARAITLKMLLQSMRRPDPGAQGGRGASLQKFPMTGEATRFAVLKRSGNHDRVAATYISWPSCLKRRQAFQQLQRIMDRLHAGRVCPDAVPAATPGRAIAAHKGWENPWLIVAAWTTSHLPPHGRRHTSARTRGADWETLFTGLRPARKGSRAKEPDVIILGYTITISVSLEHTFLPFALGCRKSFSGG